MGRFPVSRGCLDVAAIGQAGAIMGTVRDDALGARLVLIGHVAGT